MDFFLVWRGFQSTGPFAWHAWREPLLIACFRWSGGSRRSCYIIYYHKNEVKNTLPACPCLKCNPILDLTDHGTMTTNWTQPKRTVWVCVKGVYRYMLFRSRVYGQQIAVGVSLCIFFFGGHWYIEVPYKSSAAGISKTGDRFSVTDFMWRKGLSVTEA